MPYSFTNIEKDKTPVIGLVFFFLILFYFFAAFALVVIVRYFFQPKFLNIPQDNFFSPRFTVTPSLEEAVIIFLVALGVAVGHWLFSVTNLVAKILWVLKAEDLNPADSYHRVFQNIVEEVGVATGGKKFKAVVVPSMSLNAFALADFQGNAVIGATEGLLARLTRPQLEAVVGHEAAHLVSGDCLATTVVSSLSDLYSGLLCGIDRMLEENGDGRSVYARGRGVLLLGVVYLVISVTKFLSHLLRMFLSRQREYRADAVAVRLTRDPLALAEALYAVSYHWHGQGLGCEELGAIFIVNSRVTNLEERNGFWPDLLTTHPPVDERVRILLDMAHADVQTILLSLDKSEQRPRSSVPTVMARPSLAPEGVSSDRQWMIHQDGVWEGPFGLAQIKTLEGIRPETWIQRVGNEEIVRMAHEDLDLKRIVFKNEGEGGDLSCPRCAVALGTVHYEGVEIPQCPFCGGVLVPEKDVTRIIIRRDVGFDERIQKIARGFQKEILSGRIRLIEPRLKADLYCPSCVELKSRMIRRFYTLAYPVEIDQCHNCSKVWFDKDELEILQCLIEMNAP